MNPRSEMPLDTAVLRLKPAEDRRIRLGHVWVFSNEVDVERSPLTDFERGQPVIIENSKGRAIGTGFVNPSTLICARLISHNPGEHLDRAFLVRRLRRALEMRERMFREPYYRWAFAESDGLPGLIVDRYDDVIVLQINTAGMERVRDWIFSAIDQLVHPRAILMRNDSSTRALEGLPEEVGCAVGASDGTVRVRENGCEFVVDALKGQKTGWFFDQRMNRTRMREYVRGQRVLDVFSYVGGWSVQAAAAGATHVTAVDSSAAALDRLRANARHNQVAERVQTIEDDAFEVLKKLRADRERFDVVIVDPPALVKRKKDIKEGTAAYHHLNQLAIQLVHSGGVFISCSCSFHLSRGDFANVVLTAGRNTERRYQIIEQGHQGPDHPTLPFIPETEYLKAFFTRVLFRESTIAG
jgi:23S rRNA (cytosine1962-C5)-methyltransferase